MCGVELQEGLMCETKQDKKNKALVIFEAQWPPLNTSSSQAELALVPLNPPGFQLRVSPHLIIGIYGYLVLLWLTEWGRKNRSIAFLPLSCCFLPRLP